MGDVINLKTNREDFDSSILSTDLFECDKYKGLNKKANSSSIEYYIAGGSDDKFKAKSLEVW